MGTILEQNFNSAVGSIEELVKKETSDNNFSGKYIITQVAYNINTFKLQSAALTASEDGIITREMMNDPYYKMVFVSRKSEDVLKHFRDKFMFKLAYADISFALFQAYRLALMSESGEYTLDTSFYKPAIDDSSWAYQDVFHYSEFGHFLCWFSFDEEYKHVQIQADADFITQYDDLNSTSGMPVVGYRCVYK